MIQFYKFYLNGDEVQLFQTAFCHNSKIATTQSAIFAKHQLNVLALKLVDSIHCANMSANTPHALENPIDCPSSFAKFAKYDEHNNHNNDEGSTSDH